MDQIFSQNLMLSRILIFLIVLSILNLRFTAKSYLVVHTAWRTRPQLPSFRINLAIFLFFVDARYSLRSPIHQAHFKFHYLTLIGWSLIELLITRCMLNKLILSHVKTNDVVKSIYDLVWSIVIVKVRIILETIIIKAII